jgi:large subunit ribosomal protein L10e
MRNAFGKNVGTAARMEQDQPIMTIQCGPAQFALAKEALWKASMKYPVSCYIDVEKGKELVP